MKAGRPTEYTKEVGDILCERIASGLSMVKACIGDDMPAPRTVYAWLRIYPEFQQNYVYSKEEQADLMVDEIKEIADDGRNDYMDIISKDGGCEGYRANGEVIQRSKLRVDTRKWAASRFNNKKYGDKIQTDATVKIVDLSKKSDEELQNIINGE